MHILCTLPREASYGEVKKAQHQKFVLFCHILLVQFSYAVYSVTLLLMIILVISVAAEFAC